MAHFAQIIADKVTQVIVVSNDDCAGGTFPESEAAGQTFIASLGLGGEWKQTSYNANFRGVYAGIGYNFDRVNDVFVAPVVNGVFVAPIVEELVPE
jgi:hypothetical protein